jgi:predicted Zn-dependent protease
MTQQGYEPEEMVEMFRTLGRVSEAAGGGRVPEWMSTHPDPANRETTIAQAIQREGLGDGEVGRDRFLDRIDGLLYGANPRQGFFIGSRFHHPEMAFRFDFPEGWKTANQTSAVVGVSPQQDALIQLSLAAEASAEEAARNLQQSQEIRILGGERTQIGGFDALVVAIQAQTQQGIIQAHIAFIEDGDQVIQLMGYTPDAGFERYARVIDRTLASYARESDPAILGAQPWQIDIVKTNRAMSQDEFLRTYPGPVDATELARLNQLETGERYRSGVRYKRVVGKRFAPASR